MPPTVDSLLRVVQAYEGEVAMLKLLVDKLKLQLLRARRAQFGPTSEQLENPQIALLQAEPLDEHPAPKEVAKAEAANSDGIDRRLPAHLPRENQVHRPEATDALRDAAGNACGCTACRPSAPDRPGRLRATRIRAGPLQGDSPSARTPGPSRYAPAWPGRPLSTALTRRSKRLKPRPAAITAAYGPTPHRLHRGTGAIPRSGARVRRSSSTRQDRHHESRRTCPDRCPGRLCRPCR